MNHLNETYDLAKTKASALELAQKSKDKKTARRAALAAWRAAQRPWTSEDTDICEGERQVAISKKDAVTSWEMAALVREGKAGLPGPAAELIEYRTQHKKALERGNCARYWGLAARYLEGKPYLPAELKCHKNNRPSALSLAYLIDEVAREPLAAPAAALRRQELQQAIQTWLDVR